MDFIEAIKEVTGSDLNYLYNEQEVFINLPAFFDSEEAAKQNCDALNVFCESIWKTEKYIVYKHKFAESLFMVGKKSELEEFDKHQLEKA